MSVDQRAIAVLIGALSLSLSPACGERSRPAPASQPPAKVAALPGETSLATVTLTPEAEARLGIEVAPVESRAMPRVLSVAGEVIVPTGGATVLLAPFSAKVSAAPAGAPRAGASVKRGQPLARLSPLAPLDRDVHAQAEKAVSVAEAQLATVEARVSRLEKLLSEGGSSEKQVEEARSERAVLQATLEAAKKRVEAIRRAPLEADVSIALTSPRDGVIRAVSVAPGQLVSAGAPLFEILGSPALWVRASVYAGDVGRVPVDAPARIGTLGARPDALPPVVAQPVPAPPSADALGATVDLFYELPEGTLRRPGERVTVTLLTAQSAEKRVVPWSSVVFDAAGGAWVYSQASDHVFERRRVDVAQVDEGRALLARGPAPGTLVVRAGAAELFGVEFGVGK